MYDAEALPILESEARAAAHLLGITLSPVQQRLAAELDAFDLLSATPDDCRRRQELERLLAAMQAYCEAAAAYNAQLVANLTEAENTAHREAGRAAFFLHELKLTSADLVREQAYQLQQLETVQLLLRRAA